MVTLSLQAKHCCTLCSSSNVQYNQTKPDTHKTKTSVCLFLEFFSKLFFTLFDGRTHWTMNGNFFLVSSILITQNDFVSQKLLLISQFWIESVRPTTKKSSFILRIQRKITKLKENRWLMRENEQEIVSNVLFAWYWNDTKLVECVARSMTSNNENKMNKRKKNQRKKNFYHHPRAIQFEWKDANGSTK